MDLYNKFVHKYGRLPTEYDPDYLEMLRMSKYRILAVPDLSPGKCGNCGASKNDGRQYVDFGLLVEWYGTVYLCGWCLEDIAQHMGLFKELQKQLAEFITKQDEINELKEKGENLHESIVSMFKEFEEYYAGLHSIGDDSPSDISPYVEPDKNESPESGASTTKSRTTKPSAKSGSENIRSLADLLNANDK